MTPMDTKAIAPIEGMTTAQAGRAADRFLEKCRKEGKKLPKDKVQIVLEEEGDELAQEMFEAVCRRVEAKLTLISLDPTTVTLLADHNPDEFFQARSGLWVSGDFRRLVVAKAQPSKAGVSFKLNRHTLAKNLTDREIEAALPASHLFDETQVCAIVADFIAEQEGGKAGTLLNDGRANLLYTASRVVRVIWNAVYREWIVDTWTRDDRQWNAEFQVFSLATDC